VDQILDTGNALLTEDTSDDRVVIESNSLSVDLTEASLVDEFADGVASGVTIGNIRLDHADHVDGGAVELDEDTVVELSKSEELHDLLLLGWQLVNTSGSDNKSDLGLSVNVEVSSLLGGTLGINDGLVGISVLLGVLGGIGSCGLAGSGTILLVLGALISHSLEELGVSLLLLDDVFGDVLCHCD